MTSKTLFQMALTGLMAGGSFLACNDSTTSNTETGESLSEKQAAFRKACEDEGKKVEVSATCGGHNSCQGLQPDGTKHDCAGQATCQGALSCLDKDGTSSTMQSATAQSSAVTASSDSQVAAGEKLAAFRKTCTDEGKKILVSESCQGHNTCKGISPDGTEHECAGNASCQGALTCM